MATVPNLQDIQSALPLYDTLVFATDSDGNAVPTLNYMFTEPVSATKSRQRTNMTQAGRLEAPRSFIINAIRVVFGPRMHFQDLYNLYENYILRLVVGDKDYAMGGFEFFPGGGGLVVTSSAAAATTASGTATVTEKFYGSNGVQDPRAINALEHPIVIGQGENFRVEIEGTSFTTVTTANGGTGLWLRVYLDGVIARQVQ